MATTEQDVRTDINSKIKLNKKNLITGPVLNGGTQSYYYLYR